MPMKPYQMKRKDASMINKGKRESRDMHKDKEVVAVVASILMTYSEISLAAVEVLVEVSNNNNTTSILVDLVGILISSSSSNILVGVNSNSKSRTCLRTAMS